jgi:hypothetical protein
MEHAIRLSDLEAAKNTNDIGFLEGQLATARKVIQAGGTVKIQQQLSDATMETLHVLDTLELVESFLSNYLNP